MNPWYAYESAIEACGYHLDKLHPVSLEAIVLWARYLIDTTTMYILIGLPDSSNIALGKCLGVVVPRFIGYNIEWPI